MKTRSVEIEPIIIDFSEDKVISDYLSVQSKHTKRTYSTYMKRLLEFTNQNGKQILAESEQWRKRIFEFYTWLKAKGYSSGYCQSTTAMVRSFFGFYDKPLNLRKFDARKLSRGERVTTDYKFDKATLQKMIDPILGTTLLQRYVCAVGKSFGLRSEEFVEFHYSDFRKLNLDNDAPIYVGRIFTKKEGVYANAFLDSDSIPIVKALLEQNRNKKDSDKVYSGRAQDLSPILRRLASKVGIKTNERIRFHCLRAYLCNCLGSVCSESTWKTIVGKKCHEDAYINNPEKLREAYVRAMNQISVSHVQNVNLSMLTEAQKEIDALKAINEKLLKKLEALESGQNTMHKSITDLEEFRDVVEKKLRIKQSVEF